MRIDGREYEQLLQLAQGTTDPRALDVTVRWDGTWELPTGANHEWAVREVEDWRQQHAPLCRCWGNAGRVAA